ncbi:ubiquitin-conjugating enzyme E2 T [Hyperolius riggenbachi]|uniref:ubiquitin-conjugating enzyme E2 T n=1 Tax=Hyperolius riggenbachi TaxID=752182 RepID=UPI0035A3B6C8
MQRQSRLKRELLLLSTEPPAGVSCWQAGERTDELRAQVVGAAGSPYEGGVFSLEVTVPERYPFEPPRLRFLTPIYHPNIDSAGRICLDILKLPPGGAWRPALSLSSVLTSVQLLMSEPNPEDPLMADIAQEYKYEPTAYSATARSWTQKHAVPRPSTQGPAQEEPQRSKLQGPAQEEPQLNKTKGHAQEEPQLNKPQVHAQEEPHPAKKPCREEDVTRGLSD